MPKPTKISLELIDFIADHIKNGGTIADAAEAAGLSKQTLYTWMDKGKRGQGPLYKRFLARVAAAQTFSDPTRQTIAQPGCTIVTVEKYDNTGQRFYFKQQTKWD